MTTLPSQHDSIPPLSDATRSIWAKSHVDPLNGAVLDGWLPLYQHLDDAAHTAALLWDHWVPRSIKRLLSAPFGAEKHARALAIWLAGTHDVGKASPAFSVQVPRLAAEAQAHGLPIDSRIAGRPERQAARHELVSFLAIGDWLANNHGFRRIDSRRIASIAAAHHGNPPNALQIRAVEPQDHLVGGVPWQRCRVELLKRADALWADATDRDAWRDAELTQPVLVLLSSLVIISDWVASSDAFPVTPLGLHPREPARTRAARAWRQLDFPQPWSAKPETTDATRLLAERFTLPEGATARSIQVEMVALAQAIPHPGLIVLEAEMGTGKTEAALLAAEILAARFGLSGVFVGLPTRATADGMFGRVLTWMKRLNLSTPSNVYLAHGASSLNLEYEELREHAHFRSIGVQPLGDDVLAAYEPVIAHRWFSAPRRGPLSNFVVGTVDQALFAGHRSRYLMLRHLALASKVVIIDEAHAYDDYMSTYVTRVLEWLGAYSVPVIMLSATLPAARRAEFHEAYARGQKAVRSEQDTDDTAGAAQPAAEAAGYPVITATSGAAGPTAVFPAPTGVNKSIQVEHIPDDNESLLAIVRDALHEGGNLAIIRNTVRRAQETAEFLRTQLNDIPITVAHSRFLAVDRARKDRGLLHLYGPRGSRPAASIVVATQVIEQSLDVDFDVLVSDLAPVDLLLQRVGRLHRHPRATRPARLQEPRLVITGVDATTTPPTPEAGSRRVYELAVLLRTLAVLRDRRHLVLPDEIAPLVETVYGSDSSIMPAEWRDEYDHAERSHLRTQADQRQRAESYTLQHVPDETSLLGWLTGSDVDPDLNIPGRGTVRDSDGDTLEVIVLQRGPGGALLTPTWLAVDGGTHIPENAVPSPALSRVILGCKLRLPVAMCGGDAIDRHIDALERSFELPTWHSSHLLKGELVLVLDADGRGRLNEFDVSYDDENGLTFERRRV